MGLAAIPRGTSVRSTRTPSGRCEGIVVLPSSGGASETPEGTTVRSSIYVVVRLGAFFTSSLLTGRTFVGTRVRGIIVCPVGKRHPVGRGGRDPGCPPSRYPPAPGRGGRRRHRLRLVCACERNRGRRGARRAAALRARSRAFRNRWAALLPATLWCAA